MQQTEHWKTNLCTNCTILWVFMKKTSRSAFLCNVAAWLSKMFAIWKKRSKNNAALVKAMFFLALTYRQHFMFVQFYFTLWLGNWQRTEVMLLAYWAMTLRISFSTLGVIRPATLVMISCSSNSGSEGSLSVFIKVATHSFSYGQQKASKVRWLGNILGSYNSKSPE